jgi:ABC-2 type transport system permease protein
MASPIADLSYRDYDGPLIPPTFRWWVIAKQGILIASKKRGLQVLSFLSAWYYLAMMVILFFIGRFAGGNTGRSLDPIMKRIVWKDQFLHGFSYAQLPLLLIALILGAGAIANDNRSRALLVYLSKPCTKMDYLFGKFIGVFLPMFLIIAVPTTIFYGYCSLSFADYGFLRDAPWLLPQILVVIFFSTAMNSALVLAVSSMFDQGRLAGAAYAAMYFISNFFTFAMLGTWRATEGTSEPAKTLFYASIDGIQIGLCKAVLATSGTTPFGAPDPNAGNALPIPPPNLWGTLAIMLFITLGSLFLAWRRIRAVEVV